VAGLDSDPLQIRQSSHDGQVLCLVCSTTDIDAEHEWCVATSGLVCRRCCQGMLLADVSRIMSAGLDETLVEEDEPGPLGACAGCERGRRWFAQHVLGFMTRGSLPS
jgi:hypothetical protein